jgi:hypothetical protein
VDWELAFSTNQSPGDDVGPSGFLYSVVISEKSMTLLARGYLSLSPNRRKFLISEH